MIDLFKIILISVFISQTSIGVFQIPPKVALQPNIAQSYKSQIYSSPTIIPLSTPTPTDVRPSPTPTVYINPKVEVKLYDVQNEYRGIPYLCDANAVPKLKEFEPQVIEVTKNYRDCDATSIDEAIEKGYLCKAVCDDSGNCNKTVCPESATRHLEECQAPAKETWDKWAALKQTYCRLKLNY